MKHLSADSHAHVNTLPTHTHNGWAAVRATHPTRFCAAHCVCVRVCVPHTFCHTDESPSQTLPPPRARLSPPRFGESKTTIVRELCHVHRRVVAVGCQHVPCVSGFIILFPTYLPFSHSRLTRSCNMNTPSLISRRPRNGMAVACSTYSPFRARQNPLACV